MKAFVSSTSDNFRAPYDRSNRDWPRQCTFAASTNQYEYLKDSSGNTRFAPIATGEVIRHQDIARDRDQLFAEAVLRYRAGERRYATREEQQQWFEPEQASREIEDPWYARIASFLDKWAGNRITQNEILDECLKIDPGKVDGAKQMSTRIGIAIRRAGWQKRRERSGPPPGRAYYYERPQADVSAVDKREGKTVAF